MLSCLKMTVRFQAVEELKLDLKFTNASRLGFQRNTRLGDSQLPRNTRKFYVVHDSASLSEQPKISVRTMMDSVARAVGYWVRWPSMYFF